MLSSLVSEQLLNGFGYGLMLFMLAAGLTLVLGVMQLLNLAHGSLFMLGGYIAAIVHVRTGSFAAAVLAACFVTALVALMLEALVIRRLYARGHMDQMVATFGLVLIADDAVKMIWGARPLLAPTPEFFRSSVELVPGVPYSMYRLLVIGIGLLFAVGLYVLVNKTRLGMLVRAGASNRTMTELMGVKVDGVFVIIFLIGAVLAAVAGAAMGPISTVQAGMGAEVFVSALVVIVIGGIGSVRGAFVASLLVGVVDVAGRAFLTPILRALFSPSLATDLGPALASISIYLLMIGVLVFKKTGLFAANS